jgi:hypothetical protein
VAAAVVAALGGKAANVSCSGLLARAALFDDAFRACMPATPTPGWRWQAWGGASLLWWRCPRIPAAAAAIGLWPAAMPILWASGSAIGGLRSPSLA